MTKRIIPSLLLAGGLILPLGQVLAQPRLTDVTVFTTDSSGGYGGYNVWDTRPTTSNPDTYITFIQSGPPGGPFLTGPSAANAQPNISLSPGSSSFTLFGYPGFNTLYFGMNLFFNGSTTPSISVYGPALAAPGPHAFSANASLFTIPPGPFGASGPTQFIPGSGTLSFSSGGEQITLTDFYWALPSVYNLDMVGPYSTGATGTYDFVGGITLSVSPVPEPGMSLWSLGLVLASLSAWFRARPKR